MFLLYVVPYCVPNIGSEAVPLLDAIISAYPANGSDTRGFSDLPIFRRDKIRQYVKMLPGIKEEEMGHSIPKRKRSTDDENEDEDEHDVITAHRKMPGDAGGLEMNWNEEEKDYYYNRLARIIIRRAFPSLMPSHVQAVSSHLAAQHSQPCHSLSPPPFMYG